MSFEIPINIDVYENKNKNSDLHLFSEKHHIIYWYINNYITTITSDSTPSVPHQQSSLYSDSHALTSIHTILNNN